MKVVARLIEVTDGLGATNFSRRIGQPLSGLSAGVKRGTVEAEFLLFRNDHVEVASRLRSFLANLPRYGIAKFYELDEG